MDNILTSSTRAQSPYYLFFKQQTPIVKHLKAFGDMGIVTKDAKIRSKLSPRGIPCMFVGYPEDTTPDVYRMLNIHTNRIIKTKDILWLNKNYG